MQRIRNADELRRAIAKGNIEFRLCLGGCLYSAKTVFLAKDGRFMVVNHIDGSEQVLTEKELYTESNIGEGMKKGAFVVSP